MQTSSTILSELLGDKLLTSAAVDLSDGSSAASATVSTADALAGKKAVGLYFSAHWCPPCRGFTPALAEMYTNVFKAMGLEIIFVSSDKSESEFQGYFAEQPWLALPYEDRAKKAALSKKYKVQGIPTLVILDAQTGETITTDGREAVTEDPKGANFPWKPPSFWDVLGDEFLSGTDGETVGVEELQGEGKVIGLYFSAHWCPPCRNFTPDLIKSYNESLKAKGCEIIFVSSDRDQKSFLEYYGTMPWLAIPNGDKRKDKLSKLFGVQGIPTFVLVDAKTGATITTKARGNVSSDPTGAEFPWAPKALVNLGEDAEGINEDLSLCVMLEGCDEATTAKAKAVLEGLAEDSKKRGEDTRYFYAPAANVGVSGRIRELTKLGSPTAEPAMVLLDIADEGGYYVSPAKEVTPETVTSFLEGYKAGALERLQLS